MLDEGRKIDLGGRGGAIFWTCAGYHISPSLEPREIKIGEPNFLLIRLFLGMLSTFNKKRAHEDRVWLFVKKKRTFETRISPRFSLSCNGAFAKIHAFIINVRIKVENVVSDV